MKPALLPSQAQMSTNMSAHPNHLSNHPSNHPSYSLPPTQPPLSKSRTIASAEAAWLQLASTAQLLGDIERAQQALETVIRHNPYNVAAFVRLGHLLHNQQQYMQAAEAYQKAISLLESQQTTVGGVTLTSVWASLAHCWLLLDDLPRAFHAYQQALGYPGGARDAVLWFGVGLLYDRYAANEHALEAFAAVIKLETTTAKLNAVPSSMMREVYYRVGMLLRFRKSYDAALSCFEYASHFPPAPLQKADVNLQIAVTFDAKGDMTAARRVLESVVVKEGRRAVASRGKSLLGWLLVRSGPSGEAASSEQEKGLEMLRQVVDGEPGDALAWYYLGRAYIYRKMYTQSYEAYQEAVYRDSQNAAFWNSIGILYLEIHQFRDALDAFSRAIHQNPSIAEVWWNLGILYEACNNQVNDALDAYQRASELEPTDETIKARISLRKSRSNNNNNNNNNAPTLSTTEVREIDPLPYLTRPILLGSAHIPPQKSGPPATIPSTQISNRMNMVMPSNRARPGQFGSAPPMHGMPLPSYQQPMARGTAVPMIRPGMPATMTAGPRPSIYPYVPSSSHSSSARSGMGNL